MYGISPLGENIMYEYHEMGSDEAIFVECAVGNLDAVRSIHIDSLRVSKRRTVCVRKKINHSCTWEMRQMSLVPNRSGEVRSSQVMRRICLISIFVSSYCYLYL